MQIEINTERFTRSLAVAAILMLVCLAGCRSTESVDPDVGAMSETSQGADGTGVGRHSVNTQVGAQTGSSTQTTGTGYAGSVTAPGPGQSGR